MNNEFKLIGHLARNIDVYGDGVATITVVPVAARKDEEPQFIQVKVFKNVYKNVSEYLVTGKLVALDGHIATNRFTDKAGKERFEQDLVVDRVFLLSPQKKEEAVKAPAKKATKKASK